MPESETPSEEGGSSSNKDSELWEGRRPALPRADPDSGLERTGDLEQMQVVRGRTPGQRYVRIVRPFAREFRRRGPGYLVATERVLAPHGLMGRASEMVRRVIIGRRIATERELQERVNEVRGLAIFASDNISSSAYATEEIMRVLMLAGLGALSLTMPITLVIVSVLAIVVASYQQTISGYPNGGGSYIVASDNLGSLAGLVAAGALLTDYVLTVSVSVAAGVLALTSIFPELFEVRVGLGVGCVLILCLGNLRGLRESATIFAAPTYVYLVGIFGLLGYGFWLFATHSLPAYSAPPEWTREAGTEPLGLLLVLRAFASGSVALTGTEAVSNGVPMFKPPEARRARTVLILMGSFFGSIFLGMSFLSTQLGIVPDPTEVETVVSQLTRTLVGAGTPFHYLIQIATALLLVLAANTAFSGFPLLASILARDRFMPGVFKFRGERLAFSTGIIVLAVVASLLIIAFQGSVTNLIPLYTVGVFVAFTLSQGGMVRHWWRLDEHEHRWIVRAFFNGVGAIATCVVAIVVGVAKFTLGAWMVLVLVPSLIAVMASIRRHYREVEDALSIDPRNGTLPRLLAPHVLVLVSGLDRATLHALAFARSLSTEVSAVHVTDDPQTGEGLQQRWETLVSDVQLEIVESPYRALVPPLLAYIDAVERMDPGRPITVVLAELVPRHFWEYFLHNQTALRLKLHLFFHRNTIVVDVPYHLNGWPEGTPTEAEAAESEMRR